MTITDEERREVARRLRSLACTPDEIGIVEHAVIRNLGISAGIYDDCCRSEDVFAVADLIDRPTCHDAGSGYTFRCSECGCELGVILMDSREGEPAMTVHDDPLYEPCFCPNCGAVVVR